LPAVGAIVHGTTKFVLGGKSAVVWRVGCCTRTTDAPDAELVCSASDKPAAAAATTNAAIKPVRLLPTGITRPEIEKVHPTTRRRSKTYTRG